MKKFILLIKENGIKQVFLFYYLYFLIILARFYDKIISKLKKDEFSNNLKY